MFGAPIPRAGQLSRDSWTSPMTTDLSSLKPISMVEEFPLFTVKKSSAQLGPNVPGSGKIPSLSSLIAWMPPETMHNGGVVIILREVQPRSP